MKMVNILFNDFNKIFTERLQKLLEMKVIMWICCRRDMKKPRTRMCGVPIYKLNQVKLDASVWPTRGSSQKDLDLITAAAVSLRAAAV